jgi:putative aminopeptidase FrvX
MDSFALLEKLCNLPGVPGFEEPVRANMFSGSDQVK